MNLNEINTLQNIGVLYLSWEINLFIFTTVSFLCKDIASNKVILQQKQKELEPKKDEYHYN